MYIEATDDVHVGQRSDSYINLLLLFYNVFLNQNHRYNDLNMYRKVRSEWDYHVHNTVKPRYKEVGYITKPSYK